MTHNIDSSWVIYNVRTLLENFVTEQFVPNIDAGYVIVHFMFPELWFQLILVIARQNIDSPYRLLLSNLQCSNSFRKFCHRTICPQYWNKTNERCYYVYSEMYGCREWNMYWLILFQLGYHHCAMLSPHTIKTDIPLHCKYYEDCITCKCTLKAYK